MHLGDGASGTITQPEKEGGIVAIYYLGTLFGALGYVAPTIHLTCFSDILFSGGALSDKIGRNKAIIFAGFWGLLGQSLQAAAQNTNWMLCARVIAGIGTGGISAVIPVWSSELVAHDARGMVIAFEMVVNFAGISASCK